MDLFEKLKIKIQKYTKFIIMKIQPSEFRIPISNLLFEINWIKYENENENQTKLQNYPRIFKDGVFLSFYWKHH